jgi:hypothetical protein
MRHGPEEKGRIALVDPFDLSRGVNAPPEKCHEITGREFEDQWEAIWAIREERQRAGKTWAGK